MGRAVFHISLVEWAVANMRGMEREVVKISQLDIVAYILKLGGMGSC